MSVLGVDVGGTFLRMGLYGGGAVERPVKRLSAEVFGGEAGAAEGLARALRDYLAGERVEAVGVGVPGTLSRDGATVLNVPNIPALNGLPLRAALEGALGVPVFVENDITMLLTGDALRLGLTEGVVYGFYLGTGLGGAVLVDGELLRGRSGLCEPGHMPVYGLDRPCGCGKRGCAQAYVAGKALQELRDARWPELPIEKVFTAMSEGELADYVEILANVLVSAVQILDPEAVVMGGGVCAMEGFPREALLRRARELCMAPVPAGTLRLLYPPQDPFSGVYGAAVFAGRALNR